MTSDLDFIVMKNHKSENCHKMGFFFKKKKLTKLKMFFKISPQNSKKLQSCYITFYCWHNSKSRTQSLQSSCSFPEWLLERAGSHSCFHLVCSVMKVRLAVSRLLSSFILVLPVCNCHRFSLLSVLPFLSSSHFSFFKKNF